MKLRLCIVVFFICIIGFSQEYNTAMSVFKSDLELTSYSKDSTANALVIYDYGKSFVDKNTFWLRVQNQKKIKILRPEGIERGQFEIKLYKGKSSEEKIENISATTYNLVNGKIVKSHLSKDAIFKEENEKYTLVKFVLPQVKVGSVLTVRYETQSRFMSKYQPWYFQGPDPVMYSEYNTSIPGNYEYHVKLVGGVPLETNDVSLEKRCLEVGLNGYSDCGISKYVMKDIPAYKLEDYATTELNYISRIEYELSVFRGFDGVVNKIAKTWKDADKELETDGDFGRQISKKSLVKNILPESISLISDKLTKAKAIYQFVLDNYKWNGKSERYDVSIKTLNKEKVGSSFEINLLLENLLNIEGIKASPILISTRQNGLITKIYPVLSDFNYVILKVIIDEENYYLDATDPYISFGELPFRTLNQYGRLIDFDNGSYWEPIIVNDVSAKSHSIELSSYEDDHFIGRIKSKSKGYYSYKEKKQFDEDSLNYNENTIDDYTNIKINDHKVIDYDKTKSEFNETLDFSMEPEIIGNKIYLNPFILKFFEKNPFQLQERTYPIDFGYKSIFNYRLKIDLNDNLKVVEMPTSVNYALPNNGGRILFNTNLSDNVLTLYFNIKFNKPIYLPESYPYLKIFMNKVVELQNNTVIVLENQ
ncbi:DUF3857 domain-containing protein [Winogradskyella sp. PAMC22761]|nr:DUF3857 domain-containing protein [Winogradskyella sp. PAMC22761]